MKYPKLRELKEAIKAIIKGPYTTRFPYEAHIPQEKFRGKPIPDEKECIGCGACAEVCPANAIEIIDSPSLNRSIAESPTRSIIWHYDQCIFCAQCERLCTTEKGVKLSNKEFDLATFDRKTLFSEIKKKLVLCEHCGEIITTEEHLIWIAGKLKHMTYGNSLEFSYLHKFLGLTDQPDTAPIIPNQSVARQPSISRKNLFKIACPKCRRLFCLSDEYGK